MNPGLLMSCIGMEIKKLQFRLKFKFLSQKFNYVSYQQLYFAHLKEISLKFLGFKVLILLNHLQCST
jgi:hypothetical protein